MSPSRRLEEDLCLREGKGDKVGPLFFMAGVVLACSLLYWLEGNVFLSLLFYFTCVLKLEIGFDAVVENVSLLFTLCGISRMFFLYSLQSGSLVFYVFLILTKKRFLVAENRGQICFFLHS